MKMKTLGRTLRAALITATFAGGGLGASAFELGEQAAHKAAVDADIYAYPLVTMELTRRHQRGSTRSQQGTDGPMGQAARLSRGR